MKRFERSNGLDTALYKTIPLPFSSSCFPFVGVRLVSFANTYNYHNRVPLPFGPRFFA